MYNLEDDPEERNDIINEISSQKVLRELETWALQLVSEMVIKTLSTIKSKMEGSDLMTFYKNPDQVVMNEDLSNSDDDPLFDQFVELLNCYL